MKYGLEIKRRNAGDKISLAFLERKSGNIAKANEYLNEAKNQLENWVNNNDESINGRYNLAKIYSMDNNYDQAFQLLNTAVNVGFRNYKRFMSSPLFENIKNDSRYFKLIDRIKTIIDRERIEAGLVS